jgi:peptide deformylase
MAASDADQFPEQAADERLAEAAAGSLGEAGDEKDGEPETERPGEPEETAGDSESSEERPALDPEVQARRDTALRRVRKFGDPVLRSRARPVERFDPALREEVERMSRLMHDALGVGLAATQVGVLHRVLVYRVQPDSPVVGLVNPEIEWRGDETEIIEEGCLSLPAVHLDVERPVYVRVAARDVEGAELLIEASGLEARVLQHEVDHLDGVLILDRVSRQERKEAIRSMREAEEAAAAAA